MSQNNGTSCENVALMDNKKGTRSFITSKYEVKTAKDEERDNANRRAQNFEKELKNGNPSFVKSMLPSQVENVFWMGLPSKFCKDYLSTTTDLKYDIDLVDEKGITKTTNYICKRTGLSAGWRGFADDHKLDVGDALVFELTDPKTFKIYIFKACESLESEGSGVEDLSTEKTGNKHVQLKPQKMAKRSTTEQKHDNENVQPKPQKVAKRSTREQKPDDELVQPKPRKVATTSTKEMILTLPKGESEDIGGKLKKAQVTSDGVGDKSKKVRVKSTKKAQIGYTIKTSSKAENCDPTYDGLVTRKSKPPKLFRRKPFPTNWFTMIRRA